MAILAVELQVPDAVDVKVTEDTLTVELSDGRAISVPLGWYPRLEHANPSERANWRLIGNGQGIHWGDIDEDISVEGLLAGKPSGESQASFKRWLQQRQSEVRLKGRMAAGRFELKKSKDGQFMFNLKASNGQVILTSELYKTRPSAEKGIESIKKNAAREGSFEVKKNAKGEPYFILKSSNGREIGRSGYYSTTIALENDILSVKTNAPKGNVLDLTTEAS